MKPGRAFSLLIGVALLGAIARFNEMTPDAQASLLGAAAETARTTAKSLLSSAAATYNEMTSKNEGAAAPQPAGVPVAPRAGGSTVGEGVPARLAARTQDAEAPSGNPLWALPLKQLSMTRDRPIFSPSRRPPPPPAQALVAPVAVRQPVKSAEPEKPTVSLLGTIIGSNADDRLGVFLDTSTQSVVRLRVGEDHHGWVLRLIKAREATLVKSGEEAVVLEMPTPGNAAFSAMAGMPGVAPPPPAVVPPPAIVPPPVVAPPRGPGLQVPGATPTPGRRRSQR